MITDRFFEALGLVPASRLNELETRFQEATGRAYLEGYYDGNDDPVSGTTKSFGYRQTTGGLRDLAGASPDKILDAAWSVYQSNPIAKRSLALTVGYVLGDGLEPQVSNDTLRLIIDEFWHINRLDLRLEKFVLQLGLWGEQVYPAYVRTADGQVRLGYIDPQQVEQVVLHPDNAMEPWAVKLKSGTGSKTKLYRVIRQQEPAVKNGAVVDTPYEGKWVTHTQATLEPWESDLLTENGLAEYTGSCFLFQVNNVSNQARGFSDLLQVLDWLDQHDATLFEIGEKEQLAGFFSWDVELEAADDNMVRTRANEVRLKPPKKGSVNVHNNRERWDLKKPDLKQTESVTAARALKNHALGGLGLPEHWFADADSANRATAVAQGDPTYRTLKQRQGYVRFMLVSMLEFVRDQAEIAGRWLPAADSTIDVVMPEMTTKDITSTATALSQLTGALVQVVKERLATRATAARIWAKVASEIAEVDFEEELAELDEAEPGSPEEEVNNAVYAEG